jgi:membrane protease YdiL (CAAX protease family)
MTAWLWRWLGVIAAGGAALLFAVAGATGSRLPALAGAALMSFALAYVAAATRK